MKSGNLNFLESSGQLQACDGTALPDYHLVRHKSETDLHETPEFRIPQPKLEDMADSAV
jgi:hypothetical protein